MSESTPRNRAIEIAYLVIREHFNDLGDKFPRTLSRTIIRDLVAAGLLLGVSDETKDERSDDELLIGIDIWLQAVLSGHPNGGHELKLFREQFDVPKYTRGGYSNA